MNNIDFITEGVNMPQLPFDAIREWLCRVAASHSRRVGELCYCFCDDEYILRANRKFLGHDYYTDIITFDYTRGTCIGGDIIISLDTVRSNAEELGVQYSIELLRVIVHGVLHLCGINDKGLGERDIMERHENDALRIWDDFSNAALGV